MFTKPRSPVVLVVDDVADVRVAHRLLFEAEGFEVLEAADAAAALDAIHHNAVDVVLADIYIPGAMDGVDLVQYVSRLPRPRPAVIAMSGAPHLSYRDGLQLASDVGADRTLTKPADPELVVQTIRSLLGITAG